MKKLLQSFLVGIGYDYDEKGLKEYQEDLDKVAAGAKKLAAVAVGAATALTALTIKSTSASDELGKLAGEVNTSVEDIDAYGFALQRSGGQAEGMATSLRNLSRRASEAARGIGEGVEAFGLLGVSSTNSDGSLKNSAQLMLEISAGLQGVENARQIELADKLGLTDSIRLLQQGPAEIQKLVAEAKALGVVTEEDAFIAAEFQDGLTDLWKVLGDVARTISRELAPIMKETVKRFTEWWKINRDLVNQNIARFFELAMIAAKGLKTALLVLGGLAILKALGSIAALLKLIRVRILAATVAAIILPALLGAAALALVALIEDSFGFLEGKESLIGQLIGDFPEQKEKLMQIVLIFGTIGAIISKAVEGWEKIIELAGKFSAENAKDVARNLPGFAADSFDRLIGGDGTTDGESRIGSFIRGAGQSIRQNTIGRIEMNIFGNGDAEQTAETTVEKLQGQYEILESTTDQ